MFDASIPLPTYDIMEYGYYRIFHFSVINARAINPSAGWEVLNGFAGYDFKRLIDHAMEREIGVAAIRVMVAGAVGGARANPRARWLV